MTTRTLPASLRYFLPLACFVLLSAGFYADSRRAVERTQLEAQEQLNVKLAADLLDRRMLVIVRDLRTLAGDSSVVRLLDHPSPELIHRTEEDFLNFSRSQQVYDQIRLLDLTGQEILRVDFNAGNPRAIDPKKLQNKADRPYFKEGIRLPTNGIYLSPLDLATEGPQGEASGKPSLRVVTPITDSQGVKRGLLVLHYLGAELLGYVTDVTKPVADHLMVVNEAGYFLLAPRHEDEWGFMRQRPDLTLGHRYPASWERIKTLERGQFEDDHGLWTVASVFPGLVGQTSAGEAPAPVQGERWQIVTQVRRDALPTLFAQLGGDYGVGLVLLLLLCAAMAYFLARTRHHKEDLETRFRLYFDNAMVGMAITDTERRWQVVNPALCAMLGYSEAELRGKTWRELTHPDDLAISEEAYAKVIRGEMDGYKIDKRYIRADGQVINAYVAVQGVREANGRVDYLIGIFEDITARVAAQQALRTNEERLRRLGDNLPDSYVYQIARDTALPIKFLYISSGVRHIHGYEPEQVLADARLMIDSVCPEQLPQLIQGIADSERSAKDFVMEVQIRHRSGHWLWLQLRSRPRRQENGEMIWDGVAVDITARREAAALIQLQARRSEVLLDLPARRDTLDESAFLAHAAKQIQALTDSQLAFIHFVRDDDQVEGITWSSSDSDRFCSTCQAKACPVFQAGLWHGALSHRQPVIFNDVSVLNPPPVLPGHCRPLSRLAGVPVVDEGKVRLIAGVGNKSAAYNATDIETIQLLANTTWRIVHQHRAEQALKVALQVVNASPVVCFRWQAGPGRPVVFVSENVAGWGYSVDGLLAGQPSFNELLHPDDQARINDEVERCLAQGQAGYVLEYRLVTTDKRVLWVTDRTSIQRNADGEAEFLDGVLTDITERRRKDQELNETLTAQRQLNKRLEEAHNQLLQSEKMASIGQLAAGIAHELNNPIGFVHSNLGTLDSYLRDLMDILDAYDQALAEGGNETLQARLAKLKAERDFDYMRQDLNQLLVESKDGLARVRKIVQDLKSFSHVSEQDWQWVDLHQGLDSTLNIVWNELKYKCQVVKEYGDLPKVYCLISQLNQVFMNLLVNAGHAIETKGTITIHTARRGDNEVMIEIRDTGKGIAPEHLSRIFEPFFTTKPVGKGTGLGLSLSYGIVDKHHGRIEVDSQVGVGSTFRIILPISQETGPEAGQPTEVAP